ncbi:hypothetical protein [Corallococcus macrosporus]|uniref:Putative lipoprotein n=1 Tax=Myxococcus fulvus (strain ATCC BAA-855 / HW-1) TaxID=483219 RepID=F8CHS3_MYXFH|nr:hypothetical protein [Corallococcus macrosporus]AEI68756.1 putative lipoprotein [Corallococcus macrosporus]
MLTRIALCLAVAACLWPETTQACVCVSGTGDLHHVLKTARERASAIYRARVVPAPVGPYLGTVSVEVLDVIKGPVVAGEKFILSQGGGGDCRVRFREEAVYLIYAEPQKPKLIWSCSRTRPLPSLEDAEWRWLTSGKLPAIPVAVQRESVSCQPCEGAAPACDKNKQCTSKWEPPEALAADQCQWKTADQARCTFTSPRVPLPRDAPTSPVLVCRPEAGSKHRHTCSVQKDPHPSQAE